MIVVSTFKQRHNGKPTVFASHLVDIDTLEQFPCPQVPISEMSSAIRYDYKIGEYVVLEDDEEQNMSR